MPFWKPDNTPIGTSIASILYGLQQGEDSDLIFEPICLQDARLFAQNWGGEFLSEAVQMDGIVIPASRLDRTAVSIMRVFNASVAEGAPECTGYETDQFKKNGITSVVIVFAFTDGQAVTIFFNNPDLNPNMIAPTDTLVSWKVLLQRMDITIAVAPERGKELPIRTIAARVMKLVAKNSAAFLKRNATAAERMAAQAAVNDQVNGLNTQLEAKAKVIEELNLSVVTKTGEFQAAAKEHDSLKAFLAALPEPPAQSQNITATGADGEYIYSFDGGMVRLQAPVGDFGQFELSVQYADKPIKTYSRLSTIDMPSILDQAGVIDIGYSKSKKKNAPPVIHTIDRKGLTFVSGESDFLGNVLTNALPSIQYVGIDSYMDFAPFTDVNIVSAGSENVYFVKNEGNEYRVEYVTKLLNPRDFTEGQNIDLWAYVQENYADDVNSSADYRFDALKDALVNGFAWMREGDNLSRDDDKCKLSLSKDGFGVSLVDVTNAATVAIFDLPASFYKWVAQDKATEIESKIVEYERDLPAKSDLSGASLDDIAGKYPPVENSGSGYYTAYKNDKKIDSWLARFDGSQWYVSANNASTRAYNNGMGKPKFFATIEDMIKTYPAFAGLPALLAAEAAENPPAAPRYDKIYDAIGSLLISQFGWKKEDNGRFAKESGAFFMVTDRVDDKIYMSSGSTADNAANDAGSIDMVAPNGGDELLNVAKAINDQFNELIVSLPSRDENTITDKERQTMSTMSGAVEIMNALAKTYGWKKETYGGISKSFDGVVPNIAVGALAGNSRTYVANYNADMTVLRIEDNTAPTGGTYLITMDMTHYLADPEAGAKAFNEKVDFFMDNLKTSVAADNQVRLMANSWVAVAKELVKLGYTAEKDSNGVLTVRKTFADYGAGGFEVMQDDHLATIKTYNHDTVESVSLPTKQSEVQTVANELNSIVEQEVSRDAQVGVDLTEEESQAAAIVAFDLLGSNLIDSYGWSKDGDKYKLSKNEFFFTAMRTGLPLLNGLSAYVKWSSVSNDGDLGEFHLPIEGTGLEAGYIAKQIDDKVNALLAKNPPKTLRQEITALLIKNGWSQEVKGHDNNYKKGIFQAQFGNPTETGNTVVTIYSRGKEMGFVAARSGMSAIDVVDKIEAAIKVKPNTAAEDKAFLDQQRAAIQAAKKQPDLIYRETGVFTAFFPETDAGTEAWNKMAKETDGTGKVLTIHAQSTIAQLRAAGYVVEKSKNTASMDDVLAEFTDLDTPADDLAWLTAAESNPASLLDTAKLAEFQAAATIDPRIKDDPAVSARFSAVMDAVTKEMMKAMQAKMSS